ncbi:MAG TPA: DUF2794 domain-containing protein [Ferrovibrio sp.]|jgi:hypothetical protein|uniref:DUF2794 domain-containing protein n=1 Tax=Ferrovibrio sp. TaxID=1917215 RepID=UPI002B4B878D|nr:DUF2794 domain-containing protein [Ferrovibrio sp.]HLT77046.1 DUF2794 domain-containing protein [Ferrovibrio sp.]
MSEVIALHQYRRPEEAVTRPAGAKSAEGRTTEPQVFFDRREFNLILNLYARMVGQGEWRDYAIGHDRDSCSFAVFRRSADGALYRIVKTPKLARKQGAFTILAQGGRIVRRGKDLAVMLRYFEPKREATF